MKLIRKLVLGCITVGFLATTLAATTYAWYKLGNAAFADTFELKTSTTEGFLVSVDGVNFKHTLSESDMIKGILTSTCLDKYILNEDGKLVDTFDGTVIEDANLNDYYKKAIQMYPVTSYDGVTILNMKDVKVNTSQNGSKYSILNLYFKTAASLAEDNMKYDIYLDGNDYDDGHQKASRTRVWSSVATKITLDESMDTYYFNSNTNEYELKHFKKDDVIEAYTSNTFRFSVNDLGYVKTDEYGNTYYEKENNNEPLIYDNHVRSYAKIIPLAYESELVQNLVQNNIQALTDDKICVSIKSGEITKVQMKFWIDGWDGDCFDEISGYTDEEGIQHEVVPINIQLLFNSKKVD